LSRTRPRGPGRERGPSGGGDAARRGGGPSPPPTTALVGRGSTATLVHRPFSHTNSRLLQATRTPGSVLIMLASFACSVMSACATFRAASASASGFACSVGGGPSLPPTTAGHLATASFTLQHCCIGACSVGGGGGNTRRPPPAPWPGTWPGGRGKGVTPAARSSADASYPARLSLILCASAPPQSAPAAWRG
jgi:hypothetical protein